VRVATEHALTFAGPCRPGDGLGIAGDEIVIVAPDVASAAVGLVDLFLAAGGELVTVLVGSAAAPEASVEKVLRKLVHDQHPGTELVVYHTAHRGDELLIGVE
jgi:dihydroxyacetone kinase-like predicted kinase